MIEKIYKTEEEWKKILSPEAYRVMREKDTEAPFTCQWEKYGKRCLSLRRLRLAAFFIRNKI